MAEVTTLGRHLVNQALPREFRDGNRTFGGDEMEAVLTRVGHERPELYKDITHKLVQLGRESAFTEGLTLRLSDTLSPIDRRPITDFVAKQTKTIETSGLSAAQKSEALNDLYDKSQQLMETQTYDSALAAGNPFALQVKSKSRGSKSQLAGLMSSPSSFRDAKGGLIPVFIGRSYSEGLKPWEYYAATYGARAGAVATKMAVPDAGDLGKQLGVMSADLIVTKDDCGTLAGVPFSLDDSDNYGALLARDTGGFKAGSIMDAKTTAELKKQGFDKVLLRSPMTCGAPEGLCKLCVGIRESGKFPNLRDNIGVSASSALAERIAQGNLNTKHGGKGSVKDVYAGFPVIDQLVQVPDTFRYRAAIATLDGQVDKVEPAPQGGTNVFINNEAHYVSPDQEVQVKSGDKLEAGDQISSGILNPAEIVEYKGLGEGRKYLAERLTKAFKEGKLSANRRNLEVVSRSLINRVDVDDPEGLGDFLPGDSVSYNALAYSYVPRAKAAMAKPKDAVGKYLEQPALHYTIGTKLTRKMAAELDNFEVGQVMVHDNPPGFTPIMERLRGAPQVIGKDWMAKLQGSNLKANLMKDIQYGSESEIHSTHPVPGLAYGVEFGRNKPGKITY